MIAPSDRSILAATKSNLWYNDSSQSQWRSEGTVEEDTKLIIDSNYNIIMLQSYSAMKSMDTGKHFGSGITGYSLGNITAALVTPNNFVFAGTDIHGLYRDPSAVYTWFGCNSISSYHIHSLAVSRNGILYVSASNGSGTAIYRSNDYATTSTILPRVWYDVNIMLTNIYGDVFISDLDNAWAAMYRSTDEGETWSPFNDDLTCTNVNSMIELPDGAIAAATDSGVFILRLGDCHWQPYSEGLWTNNVLRLACNSKGQLFASTACCGIFKSTKLFNDTLRLTGVIDPGSIDYKIIKTGSTLCQDVVVRNRGLKPFTINSFTVVDPTPFSVSDESAKKIPITLNPNDSVVMSICFHPQQVAVYSSQVVWNTDINPSLCGISRETNLYGIAVKKSVVSSPENNVFNITPNPIHNKSEINFTLQKGSHVKIECFDLLGRRVKILTEGNFEAGEHSVSCDFSDVPDGIYIVECTSGTDRESQSIIIVH